MSTIPDNRRILVIDDNQAIHDDFRKVLGGDGGRGAELDAAEAALFGTGGTPATAVRIEFELDSALQGQEGLARVEEAVRTGRPYAMAFVDVRMPPGWDGVETIQHLWEVDPTLQVVICTAYSDYSWEDMLQKLGESDQLLILKKPFDNIEVRQLASALTAKWRLSRAVQERVETLEEAVRARTLELESQNAYLQDTLARLQEAHAQLLQADKMASIGQLAAGVAHEINNPIGFISSNLNSLAQYVTDLKSVLAAYDELLQVCQTGRGDVAAQAEVVAEARSARELDYVLSDLDNLINESVEGTRRVRQIVADLRDFSHVDSPNVNPEDLNHLLDKTINVARNELKYKTDVVREYGELPLVPCYGGKLGQVFLNLLVNAAQSIEEHGTITIRTGVTETHAWVEIADTGSGIEPEHCKHGCAPFFPTKDVGKGTGMGLHLAYKIVEAHAGHIQFHSVVGEGTTFRIELPRSGPPAHEENADASLG